MIGVEYAKSNAADIGQTLLRQRHAIGNMARLADIEPEVLHEPRLQYRLGTGKPQADG